MKSTKTTPRPELTPETRATLEQFTRRTTAPARLVERARIVLLAAEGRSDAAVAQRLGCSRARVARWLIRFRQEGPDCLGRDRPRPGHPKTVLTPEKVKEIVDATRFEKPPAGTHWSLRSMAKRAGVAASTVFEVWQAHRLQPHRVETWKLSLDPDLAGKLADVVGLYLHPPQKAVVISIDEKSQIQALDRTQPILPLREGLPERQTHDYTRHGTTTLFSALRVLEGTILGECYPHHTHVEFLDFLQKVEATVPAGLELHAILDNYATHKHPKVKAWLAAHPRVKLHFTPTGCSWANLVERFFSELTTRRLRRDSFRSVAELEAAIHEYIAHHNEQRRPYVWTKTFEQIVVSINRCYRN